MTPRVSQTVTLGMTQARVCHSLVSFFSALVITLPDCHRKKCLRLALGHQGQGAAAVVLLMHDALPHVLLKGGRHAEGHVTKPTFELVVPHPPVGLHVPRQLAALRTGVRTQLTSVWFLARVTSPVHRQVAAVLENLSAVLARVVAAPADQVLTNIRVKDSVKSALLSQSPDSTWLHGGHLHAVGQGGHDHLLHRASSNAARASEEALAVPPLVIIKGSWRG